MDPEQNEHDNDAELIQDVTNEQSDVLAEADTALPKVKEAKDSLAETLNETSEADENGAVNGEEAQEEVAAEEQEEAQEEVAAEEQEEAQAEGVPIDEADINMNNKLSKMRGSNFAKAVAKGKDLVATSKKSQAKKVMNGAMGLVSNNTGLIGSVTGAGIAAKSAYDIVNTGMKGKNADAPTNKDPNSTTIAMSWGTSLLLSVLSIVKVYSIMKSNDSTSAKILKAIPNLLSILCNLADSIITSAAKDTQKTRNILNFLVPAKTFLKILNCIGDHTGVMSRKKKLDSMVANHTSDPEKMKPVINKLNSTAKEFLPNILSLGAKNASELGYAIAYAKNPTSPTTLGFKLASQATSGIYGAVSANSSHGLNNLAGPDDDQKKLSGELFADFANLYTIPDIYLGTEDAAITPDTFDKKEAALLAYEKSQGELEATGVSISTLSAAEDQEAQMKLIADAVGY